MCKSVEVWVFVFNFAPPHLVSKGLELPPNCDFHLESSEENRFKLFIRHDICDIFYFHDLLVNYAQLRPICS